MNESNSDVGIINELIRKINIQTDEIYKVIKYSIMERKLIMMFFYFIKKRIGSQNFQLKSIFTFYKDHFDKSDCGDSEEKSISTELNKIFNEIKKFKDIGCLSFYVTYFNL